MNFQFYCPQGHLLQGDTAHSGSVIACPICGTQFIIPTPPPAAAPVVSPVTPPVPPAENPFTFSSSSAKSSPPNLNELLGGDSAPEKPEEEEKVEMATPFDFNKEKPAEEKPISFVPKSAHERSILHIPCPHGHLLEVPREMLGEDVMCPHCKAQYKLLLENSVEFRKEQLEKTALEEAKLAKQWLQWAIIASVLVVLFLLFLFFTAM
ncbi:MAG: hypothetical protein Q4D62_12085 [Planctomycetia bacterium]|nr:hypothetical protein [Planctomycetia bacterium]